MTLNFTHLGAPSPDVPVKYERRRCTIVLPKHRSPPSIPVDEEGRPLRRCWVGPTDELSNGLGFVPLALSALCISVSILAYGVLNVYDVFSDDQIAWDEAGDLVVAAFKIVVGIMSFVGILSHWVLGVHVLLVGYNILLASSCVNFALKWSEWTMAMAGFHSLDEDGNAWVPDEDDKFFMLCYTLLFIFILLTPFWVVGVLHSLEIRWDTQQKLKYNVGTLTREQMVRFERAQMPPHKRVYSWLASLRRSSRIGSRIDFSHYSNSTSSCPDDAIV